MRLLLVRHAESTWNASGRWQGQSDVPLSPRGRLQARALAARLYGAALDRRVCSDLSRAAETAAALGEPAEPDPRLREIDVGAWAGLGRAEVAERFPEQVMGLRRGERVRIGGGESMDEFEARVDGVFDELRATHAGQRVLAVTHGGVIRALLTRILGVRGGTSPLVGASNTSLTVLECRPGPPAVAVFNDALHLDPGEGDASVLPLPQRSLRLALVAARPGEEADRRLADRLLVTLGIAHFHAVGAARETALAEQLLADPGERPGRELIAHLREAHDEGDLALVLPPEELREVVAELAGLAPEGLATPGHGSVAQLRLTARGALLCSYGVRVDADDGPP